MINSNIVVLVEGNDGEGLGYMRGMPPAPGGTLVITRTHARVHGRCCAGATTGWRKWFWDAAKWPDHKWRYGFGQLGLDRLSKEGAAERGQSDRAESQLR